MLTDYFGAWASPVSIASHKDWYTADGLILWNKLALSAMSFEKREYGWNDFAICQAMSDPDRAVILNVNDGQHWVVALRKTIFSNDYVVLDPWTGKKALAFKDYHNINGAAYFKRNKL